LELLANYAVAFHIENCKEMAPTLHKVENAYKGRVNFVVIDGDSAKNADLVDAFRVDGIPHMALITAKGDVRTALVGNVPRDVVVADLDALVSNKELPYLGYDAFAGGEHNVADLLPQ
jgi:thioredoxin-like negative regulator of GroEL